MEKEREISEEVEKNQVVADQTDPIQESEIPNIPNEPEAEEHEDDEDLHEANDFHSYSKAQFVELIEGLLKQNDIKKTDKILKEIRPYFDDIKHQERNEALQQFISSGGEEADFDFKYDELTQRFERIYKQLKEQKAKHFQEIEKKKEQNLQAKNA
ncbi:MAG: DUF349 domain-containing protein, partial [Bacteroidota bacterium]|nr:DUF349 domain-containing protein [Bacteroidota bacterium]